MKRLIIRLAFAIAVGLAGCRMCASTFDYASPTLQPDGTPYPAGYRAGSILAQRVPDTSGEEKPHLAPTDLVPSSDAANSARLPADEITRRLLSQAEMKDAVILKVEDHPLEEPNDQPSVAETSGPQINSPVRSRWMPASWLQAKTETSDTVRK